MRKNCKNLLLVFSVLLLNSFQGRAQYDLDYAEHLILKYPNSSQVICNLSKTYTLKKNKSGDGLDMKFQVNQDKLITKSGTFKLSTEEILSDSSFMELIDFDAFSYVPVKGKYQKKRVKEFFKGDEFKSSFFTSDTETTQFYYPNTEARSITHLDYQVSLNDEYVIPNTFIGFFQPVEKFEFKIIVDNDIDLDFHFFHVSNDTLNYTKNVGKKSTEHLWVFKEIPRIKYFGKAPDIRWFLPHISFSIKGYKTDDGYKSVLADLDDLYVLYQKWISLIPKEDEPKLKKIIDGLYADTIPTGEKLKKIYQWVQSNVKYIAHTNGLEGFVPRSGTDVLSCRYGDCKGMSNLMHSLADVAGIKTYRTWIGSRDIPYTYEELPTPLVDNHMILSYLEGDSVMFLDATDSYLPFGYPTQFIQGKQALIALDSATYKLAYVPVPKPKENSWIDSVWISIEGDNITGNGKLYMSGYHATRWRTLTSNRDKKEMLEFASSYLQKGDNRFVVTEITNAAADNSMTINLQYKFDIRKFVNTSENKLFINLNIENTYGESPIDDDRLIPVELSHNSIMTTVVNLEVPDSYLVDFLPKNSSHSMDDFGYDISYRQEKNQIIYSMQTFTKSLLMQPNTFKPWNELSKQFRKDIRTNVVLVKTP